MIYLDYQATTPIAPEARAAMLPYLERSSAIRIRRIGSVVRRRRRSRRRVRVLAHFGDGGGRLFFTSGATEAANWALKGAMAAAPAGRRRLVTLATEHACVLDTARYLEAQGQSWWCCRSGMTGWSISTPPRGDRRQRRALVAAMLVNNEIGVIQPGRSAGGDGAGGGGAVLLRRGAGLWPCRAAGGGHDRHFRAQDPRPQGHRRALAARRRGSARLSCMAAGRRGLALRHAQPALCAGCGAAAVLMDPAAERAHCESLRDRLLDRLGEGWTVNGSFDERWPGNPPACAAPASTPRA